MAPPNPFKTLQGFRSGNAVKGKTRTILIIIMLVAVLGIGIIAAVLGSRMGDDTEEDDKTFCKETCAPKCHSSKVEKGWKAFSITVIALGIPLLIIAFIFFGCTTAVAGSAWGKGDPNFGKAGPQLPQYQ